MPAYIQYDPNHAIVPNLIVRREKSAGTVAEWEALPNVVAEPNGFTDAPGQYKWTGTVMEAISQAEQDALNAAQTVASLADKKQALKDALASEGEITLHVLHAMVEAIHAHVASPTKTVNQLKADVQAKAIARIDALVS